MKIALFLLPVIIAGVVLGLGFAGTIQIPGISPKKKVVAKTEEPVKPKQEVAKPPVRKPDRTPKGDPGKGHEAVAAIWDELAIDKLKEVTATWKDAELVPILRKMDPDKVVQYLGAIDTERASKLTRLIQKLAESETG